MHSAALKVHRWSNSDVDMAIADSKMQAAVNYSCRALQRWQADEAAGSTQKQSKIDYHSLRTHSGWSAAAMPDRESAAPPPDDSSALPAPIPGVRSLPVPARV